MKSILPNEHAVDTLNTKADGCFRNKILLQRMFLQAGKRFYFHLLYLCHLSDDTSEYEDTPASVGRTIIYTESCNLNSMKEQLLGYFT
jgi:hypothetical protein